MTHIISLDSVYSGDTLVKGKIISLVFHTNLVFHLLDLPKIRNVLHLYSFSVSLNICLLKCPRSDSESLDSAHTGALTTNQQMLKSWRDLLEPCNLFPPNFFSVYRRKLSPERWEPGWCWEGWNPGLRLSNCLPVNMIFLFHNPKCIYYYLLITDSLMISD